MSGMERLQDRGLATWTLRSDSLTIYNHGVLPRVYQSEFERMSAFTSKCVRACEPGLTSKRGLETVGSIGILWLI